MRALPVLLSVLAATPAFGAEMSLRRVMLSSAGVGYYEYEGTAEGSAVLGLRVRLDQVDDVLKSLVVFDAAGSVCAVELPGRDDRAAAFGQLPFGAAALESPLALLNGLAGTEVAVEGPRPMRGRILRADSVREPAPVAGQEGAVRTRVTLLTEAGLKQFVLEEADAVQVADPGLRERIARAVAATRAAGGGDTREISVGAAGTGTRTLRVGFVVAAPLWKASYRLLLPPDGPGEGRARLQAWATLENTGPADWSGVSLSLQYGNPVTFHQAIWQSYFVQRLEVPVEVLGRLLPDVDRRARTAAPAEAPPPPPPPAPAMVPMAAAPRRMPADAPVAPAAEAAAVAEAATETVFTLPAPVDLPAGHSATVPILDTSLPATRVALLRFGDEHPLAALRLANTGTSSLPAGVLTLYDPAAAAPYAGDARLGGLPAGETRLVPFAQDLRTVADWRSEDAVVVAGLAATGGVLAVDQRTRTVTHATVTAPAGTGPAGTGPAGTGRLVLLEVPKDGTATVAPGFAQPSEETAAAWRFRLPLEAGQTRTLTFALDRHERQALSLLDDAEPVAAVLNLQGVPPAALAALQRVAGLRAAKGDRAAERDELGRQRDAVDADEARLRSNLQALQPGDALRSRLLRQLDADETRHAQLDGALAAADAAVQKANQALADAVAGLTL